MKEDVSEYVKNCINVLSIIQRWLWKRHLCNPYQSQHRCGVLLVLISLGLSMNPHTATRTNLQPQTTSQNGRRLLLWKTRAHNQWLHFLLCDMRMGCMETLISDQGREFVNEVIDDLMERFDTNHHIFSAYHPRQMVRGNATIETWKTPWQSCSMMKLMTGINTYLGLSLHIIRQSMHLQN